jgi:hypothetical protein
MLQQIAGIARPAASRAAAGASRDAGLVILLDLRAILSVPVGGER